MVLRAQYGIFYLEFAPYRINSTIWSKDLFLYGNCAGFDIVVTGILVSPTIKEMVRVVWIALARTVLLSSDRVCLIVSHSASIHTSNYFLKREVPFLGRCADVDVVFLKF